MRGGSWDAAESLIDLRAVGRGSDYHCGRRGTVAKGPEIRFAGRSNWSMSFMISVLSIRSWISLLISIARLARSCCCFVSASGPGARNWRCFRRCFRSRLLVFFWSPEARRESRSHHNGECTRRSATTCDDRRRREQNDAWRSVPGKTPRTPKTKDGRKNLIAPSGADDPF